MCDKLQLNRQAQSGANIVRVDDVWKQHTLPPDSIEVFAELLPDSAADVVPSTVRPLESLADTAHRWHETQIERVIRAARLQ